jgi:hypothetical protein
MTDRDALLAGVLNDPAADAALRELSAVAATGQAAAWVSALGLGPLDLARTRPGGP